MMVRSLLLFLVLSCSDEVEVTSEEEEVTSSETRGSPPTEQPPGIGELQVGAPTAASRVEGEVVSVSGTSANLERLRSGQETIPLNEDGSWSGQLQRSPGLQLLEFRADTLGGSTIKEELLVLFGPGRSPDAAVPEGLIFHISKSGMSKLAERISSHISAEELENEIQKSGALYKTKMGYALLAQASIVVNLVSLDFQSVEATIIPMDERLELTLKLHGLNVQTRANIKLGPTGTYATMSMLADPAVVRCEIVPSLHNGTLSIEVQDTQVTFESFKPRLSGIPAGLEPESIRSEIRNALETELTTELEHQLPTQINPILAELHQSFELMLPQASLEFEVYPSRLNINASGADLAFTQSIQGSYATDAMSVLALSESPAEPHPQASATLSLADDLPNRVLYEAWAQNLLTVDLSTQEGTLDTRILEALNAEEVSIQAQTGLPPVIVGTPTGLQLQIGPVSAVIESPEGGYGSHLELEISGWIDLESRIENDEIHLRMTDLETRLVLRDHDWKVPKPVIRAALSQAMDLDNRIEQLLEQIVIPLPHIPVLDVGLIELDRAPAGGYSRGALELR